MSLRAMILPEADSTRRKTGLALYVLAVVVGVVLFITVFLVPPLLGDDPWKEYRVMLVAAALALPAGLLYLTVPRILDRYDPEPAYALIGCLVWGALVAGSFSALINTLFQVIATAVVGEHAAEVAMTVVCAPFVEEFWKGLGVLSVFVFLRREFDGLVDGVIYATFVALGFATMENVTYYAEAAKADGMGGTFIVRGLLSPWCHPLFTSMTGLGIGYLREGPPTWMRRLAPVAGYAAAVTLHMIWNGLATVTPLLSCVALPFWFLFVGGFLGLIVYLVQRRGKIMRRFLMDEVALGHIDKAELELVVSPWGTWRAKAQHGELGEAFVRATARLAMCKWHSTRAATANTRTVSADFVVPLRTRIAELKRTRGTRG